MKGDSATRGAVGVDGDDVAAVLVSLGADVVPVHVALKVRRASQVAFVVSARDDGALIGGVCPAR
eukprot:4077753-Pyramimonas_sp.AAC.1